VVAITHVEVVARLQRRHQADDSGFLAQIQMAVPADLGSGVHLAGPQLKCSHQRHLLVIPT
jgi:hypothetical protein